MLQALNTAIAALVIGPAMLAAGDPAMGCDALRQTTIAAVLPLTTDESDRLPLAIADFDAHANAHARADDPTDNDDCHSSEAGLSKGDEVDAASADPVHRILHRLEASAADLDAFTADVYYETYDDLLGRREIRIGEIIYRISKADESAREITSFAVLFDVLIIGQRRSDRRKQYVFHDRWLAEIDHENRQFIKRELVPPGRKLDPLKLGEGPIPLPIGQPKDEVLARFDVTLHAVPEDGPLARLENVDGLLLIPKEGTPEANDYQRVELYYDRETNLPVGINAIEQNHNRKTVRLNNIARNPELTDEQMQHLSVEEPDPRQWSIDVRPYRTGS